VLSIAGQVASGTCFRILSHGWPFHVAHGFSLCEQKAKSNLRAILLVDHGGRLLQRIKR
jgi:hypothetical protein